MMKQFNTNYLWTILFLLATAPVFSQTGIGTKDPKATLQVVGQPTETTLPDGILLPKLTKDELYAKAATETTYGADQHGLLVYVTDVAGFSLGGTSTYADAVLTQVTVDGYYEFSYDAGQLFGVIVGVDGISFPNQTGTATNPIVPPGTYSGVAYSSSGSGTGAVFDVVVNSSNTATVNVVNTGSGYVDNEVITVPGTSLGVASPANDLTFMINGVTSTTGTRFLRNNANPWDLNGNTDTDPATNFLGTIDAKDLVLRTSNTEAVRISATQQVGVGTATPYTTLQVQGDPTDASAADGFQVPSLTKDELYEKSVGGPTTYGPNQLGTIVRITDVTDPANLGSDSYADKMVSNIVSTGLYEYKYIEAGEVFGQVSGLENIRGNGGAYGNANYSLGSVNNAKPFTNTGAGTGLDISFNVINDATLGNSIDPASIVINNPGMDYEAGDVVRIPRSFLNTSVYATAGNGINTFTYSAPSIEGDDGSYTLGVASTTGTGSGATFNITVAGGEITDFTLNAAGTNYDFAEVLTLDLTGFTNQTSAITVRVESNTDAALAKTDDVLMDVAAINDQTSTRWVRMGEGWNTYGNAGTDAAVNFVGTTDAQDFVTKTDNTERMRVTAAGNVGVGTPSPTLNFEVNGESNAGMYGDLKYSLRTTDHKGWYLLNERSCASLGGDVASRCTSFFGSTLPQTTGTGHRTTTYLGDIDGNSATVGTFNGNSDPDNLWSKDDLPSLSHGHTGGTGVQNSNHSHGVNINTGGGAHGHGARMATGTGGAGNRAARGGGGFYDEYGHIFDGNHGHNVSGNTSGISANHAHSFTTNSSNPGGSNGLVPTNPRTLDSNLFVYLGF